MILQLALALGYSGSSPADLLITNAVVYTANDRQPKAEALAVKDGRFVYVGSASGAKSYTGTKTRMLDLRGATVLPGLTDSHLHLDGVGQREMTLNLEGIESLEGFLAAVGKRAKETPTGEWITGRGWIEKHWKPQRYPTRQDLDRVAPDHPVWLVRADGHSGVANSRALKLAKIARETKNPFGGEVMKDASGEPTGMLTDHAMAMIPAAGPIRTEADREHALLLGQEFCLRHGWTQVQIAGLDWDSIARLRRLYTAGKFTLRTYVAARGPGGAAGRLLTQGVIIGDFGGRMTLRTIKVTFDGALGSKGAALLEPYSDHNSSGFLTVREEDLRPMLTNALKRGVQVETHAIGDRANRRILDLYEEAFRAVPASERWVTRDPRWRVEHAQIVHPRDIPRFRQLGVIPSMQPSHAIGDLHFAPSRLGQARLEGAYAWRTFLGQGSIIAGGSDAPVERGDPLIEFYAAVARKDLKGYSGPSWHPEQAVSRADALKMFTLWPAYAAFEEKKRGSIEVGKLADLSIFDSDIMRVAADRIPNARCLMTVIGGEVVYDGRRKTATASGN